LLDSYGIRNDIVMGYNEQAIANLIKGGRGVIIAVNAGKLWGDSGCTARVSEVFVGLALCTTAADV
jgi:hypothetical protein